MNSDRSDGTARHTPGSPADSRTPRSSSSRDKIILWSILACATWVRVFDADLGWFQSDQVRDLGKGLGILAGDFPLLGPASASGKLELVGPLYYFLIAVPLALWRDPLACTMFLGALGVASVYLTYLVGREWLGTRAALIGAALYAVFPMAVVTNRTLWNPAPVPFFAMLVALAIARYIAARNPWTLAVVLFAISALIQIHNSGVVLLAVAGCAIVVYRLPVRPGPVVVGCLLSALWFLPWLIVQLQTGSPQVPNALGWVGTTGAGALTVARAAVLVPVEAVVRSGELAGVRMTGVLELAGMAELSLLALALVIAGYRTEWRPTVLLRVWWVVPFLIFPFNQFGVLWYYFDICYPSQFLLIGALANVAGRRGRTLLTAVVVVICAVQMTFNVTFARTIRADGVIQAYVGDYLLNAPGDRTRIEEMTLGQTRKLAQAFATELGSGARIYVNTHAHGFLNEAFREGKGIMVEMFAEGRQARPTGMHYWVARCTPTARTRRALVAGAMCLIPYSPKIDPSGWEAYLESPPQGWPDPKVSGRPVTLPVNLLPALDEWGVIPVFDWGATPVLLRGRLIVERPPLRAPLGITIRNGQQTVHRVTGLLINGVDVTLPPARTNGSPWAATSEVSVDVAPYLRAGTNTIGVVVEGGTGAFDLDVYDVPAGVDSFAAGDPGPGVTDDSVEGQ